MGGPSIVNSFTLVCVFFFINVMCAAIPTKHILIISYSYVVMYIVVVRLWESGMGCMVLQLLPMAGKF